MSAISLVGASALALRERTLQRVIRQLVAFAAGALLGGAFLHMLPEAAESLGGTAFSLAMLAASELSGKPPKRMLRSLVDADDGRLVPSESYSPIDAAWARLNARQILAQREYDELAAAGWDTSHQEFAEMIRTVRGL